MTELLRLEVKRIFRMKSFWIILIVFAVNTIMWNTRWWEPFASGSQSPDSIMHDRRFWIDGIRLCEFDFYHSLTDFNSAIFVAILFAAFFLCSDFLNRTVGRAICFGYRRSDYVVAKVIAFGVACALIEIADLLPDLYTIFRWGGGPRLEALLYTLRVFLLSLVFKFLICAVIASIVMITRRVVLSVLVPLVIFLALNIARVPTIDLIRFVAHPDLGLWAIPVAVAGAAASVLVIFGAYKLFDAADLK